MKKETEAYLNVNDVAERLNVSKRTAYRIMRSPGFPTIKIGKLYRVDPQLFVKWQCTYSYKEYKI